MAFVRVRDHFMKELIKEFIVVEIDRAEAVINDDNDLRVLFSTPRDRDGQGHTTYAVTI